MSGRRDENAFKTHTKVDAAKLSVSALLSLLRMYLILQSCIILRIIKLFGHLALLLSGGRYQTSPVLSCATPNA